jgi:hypothetical protein
VHRTPCQQVYKYGYYGLYKHMPLGEVPLLASTRLAQSTVALKSLGSTLRSTMRTTARPFRSLRSTRIFPEATGWLADDDKLVSGAQRQLVFPFNGGLRLRMHARGGEDEVKVLLESDQLGGATVWEVRDPVIASPPASIY